jgi:hypothetical protein
MGNWIKIRVLVLIFLTLSTVNTFAVDEKQTAEEKEQISEEDTTKAIEIRIGDEGIYIRKETGEEYRYKKGEIPDFDMELKIKPPRPPEPQLPPELIIRARGKTSAFTTIVRHDIVKGGTDIVVEENELVKGDVTALGGDVTVKGKVEGSVVAVGGDIIVTSTGEIEKDATSIGGDVRRLPGGVIRGQDVGIGFFPRDVMRIPFRPPTLVGLPFAVRIVKISFVLFIGLVVFSVVPNHVTKVKTRLEREMLKSGLVGFLGEILVLPIFVLLIITIIGIPVAILVEPLVILLAVLLGYIAASLYIGEKVKQNTNIKPKTPLLTVLLGIIVIELIPVVAVMIGMAGPPGHALRLVLMIIYWGSIYLILTIGFGAVILTRFGTRPKEAKVATEQKNSTTPA